MNGAPGSSDQDFSSTPIVAASPCQMFKPGHDAHPIQARVCWTADKVESAKVLGFEPDAVVVVCGGETLRLRNHDIVGMRDEVGVGAQVWVMKDRSLLTAQFADADTYITFSVLADESEQLGDCVESQRPKSETENSSLVMDPAEVDWRLNDFYSRIHYVDPPEDDPAGAGVQSPEFGSVQRAIDDWDDFVDWIFECMNSLGVGESMQIGPADFDDEPDGPVFNVQFQALDGLAMWLQRSEEVMGLRILNDFSTEGIEPDTWQEAGGFEDITHGWIISNDRRMLAEACATWFRDHAGIEDLQSLGCEFIPVVALPRRTLKVKPRPKKRRRPPESEK